MEKFQDRLPNENEVNELIQGFLSGNQEKINFSTKIFKAYIKRKESIGPLLNLMNNSPNAGVRQFSCVLLQKKLLTHFQKGLNQEQKEHIKSALLQVYYKEPAKNIRKTIGYLIATIYKEICLKLQDEAEKANNKQKIQFQNYWTDLFSTIGANTQDNTQSVTKEKALILLGIVLEECGYFIKDLFLSFHSFFLKTLQDKNIEYKLRKETMRCLVFVLDEVEGESAVQYKNIIEPLLNTFDECVTKNDIDAEQIILLCLNIFSSFVIRKSILLKGFLPKLMEYLTCQILIKKQISIHIKDAILDFLEQIVWNMKPILTKDLQLLDKIITALCIVVLDKETDPMNEHMASPSFMALKFIGYLSKCIPKKKFYPICMKHVDSYMKSNDPLKQEAVLKILAYISEFVYDMMKKDLKKIMNQYVETGLKSQSQDAQIGAILSLTFFSQHLQPDIFDYHKGIVPVLLKCIQHVEEKIAFRSLFALNIFCENMEDKIFEYVNVIVPYLINFLEQQQNITIKTQKECLSALSSCICSGGQKYQPYLKKTLAIMITLLNLTKTEQLTLRAEAIKVLSHIVNVFAKNNDNFFVNQVKPLSKIIYKGMIEIDDYEIRESGFQFFYCLADAVGNKFGELFDNLFQLALKVAQDNTEITVMETQKKNNFNLDSDDEEEKEVIDLVNDDWGINFIVIQQKCAAIQAIGDFAFASPMKFAPYYKQTINILDVLYNHYCWEVQNRVIITYKQIILTTVKIHNKGKLPPVKLGQFASLPKNTEQLLTMNVLQKYFDSILKSSECEVVCSIMECICLLLDDLGASVLKQNSDDLVVCLEKLFKHETQCQITNLDQEGDFETELQVLYKLLDMMSTLAKHFKQNTLVIIQKLYPLMLSYLKPQRSAEDHTQVIGMFACFIENHPPLYEYFYKDITTYIISIPNNPELNYCDELFRNASYCIGLIVTSAKEKIYSQWNGIFEFLKFVYMNAEDQATIDNAISSIMRMVMVDSSKIPNFQQFVVNIIKELPFKGDLNEEGNGMKFLLFLCNTNKQVAQQNINHILKVMVDGIINQKKYDLKECSYPVVKETVAFLNNVSQDNNLQNILKEIVQQLNQQEQQTLQKILQN